MKKQSITRNMLINTMSTVLLRSISLITVPIISRLLTTSENGMIANYNTWLSLISVFIGLQARGSLMNASIVYSKKEYNQYLSSVLFLGLVSSIIFAIPFVFMSNTISSWTNVSQIQLSFLFLQSFGSFCIGFLNAHFIAQKKTFHNMILSLILSIATVVVSLSLATYMLDSGFGYILGQVIVNLVFGICILVFFMVRGKVFFNASFWKFCITLSIPLVFHALSGYLLSSSDRIVINQIFGEKVLAIYSFNYNIIAVISMLWTSINSAWVPFYYDYLRKQQYTEILLKTKNLLKVFLGISICFMFVLPEILRVLLPETYWEGVVIVPIIITGCFFACMYTFASNYEFFHQKTFWVAIGTVSAGLCNLLLNYLLIPKFSYIGASLATLFSYILLFVFHEYIARKKIKGFPINFRTYIPYIACLVMSVIVFYVFLSVWFIRWIIALIIGIYILYGIIKNKSII